MADTKKQQANELAETGPRVLGGRKRPNAALDNLCEIAARLMDADSACMLLKQHGLSRMVACHGLPVAMRNLAWDFSKVPYNAEDRYILPDAAGNAFAQMLFREMGLQQVGSLLRTPIVNAKEYSLSLLVFTAEARPKPAARKLKLLDETVALARREFEVLAPLLTDPAADVTIARNLAQVEKLVDASPLACFLLDAQLKIRRANAKAAELTGISKSALVGLTHADLTQPTADAVNFLYKRALETLQSPPDFEVVMEDGPATRIFRVGVTPFSPIDTRDYFLFVTVDETTSLSRHTRALSDAIDEQHGIPLPKDPSQLFLTDTLVHRRTIRQRKTTNYLALRAWRQPIRDYQIKALKALKQNIPPEFPRAIATEVAAEVDALFGRSGFKAVVPMPCGHSKGEHCLSVEIARALGVELGLPVIQAFIRQPHAGSSHPKQNTKRPAMALARIIDEPVLLVDDVATTGTHIEEAVSLLKPTCGAVMAVAWIGGDAPDAEEPGTKRSRQQPAKPPSKPHRKVPRG